MRGFVITAVLALASTMGMTATAPAAAQAPAWEMDPAASRLEFVGRQNDDAVRGGFNDFTASIRFAPDDLEGASIRIEVDMTSVEVEGSERGEILRGSAWLGVEDFPTAVFTADAIEAVAGGGYRALGTLEIKGYERPVPLAFDVVITDGRAVADGRADLVRTNFDVGPEGAVFGVRVAPEVDVLFHIEAVRAG